MIHGNIRDTRSGPRANGATPPAQEWRPPACRDSAAGCVWLPRMLAKARRLAESERAGQDLLSPYMVGGGDPADGALMRFLGTNQDAVLELLCREQDDDRAAEELVRRSGRPPQECATWSEQFLQKQRLLIALLDADEGRWPPDWRPAAVRWLYNRVLMPPLSWLHRNDPNRRLGRSA